MGGTCPTLQNHALEPSETPGRGLLERCGRRTVQYLVQLSDNFSCTVAAKAQRKFAEPKQLHPV